MAAIVRSTVLSEYLRVCYYVYTNLYYLNIVTRSTQPSQESVTISSMQITYVKNYVLAPKNITENICC